MIVAGIVMVTWGTNKSSDQQWISCPHKHVVPHTIQLKKPMDIIE